MGYYVMVYVYRILVVRYKWILFEHDFVGRTEVVAYYDMANAMHWTLKQCIAQWGCFYVTML